MKIKKTKSKAYTDEQIQWLVTNKQSGCFSWDEIAEAFEEEFDVCKTTAALEKTYRTYKDFDLADDTLLANIRSAYSSKKLRQRSDKEKKVLLDKLESEDDFLSKFQELLKNCPIKTHRSTKKQRKSKIKRCVFMHLSDLHIQSFINGEIMGGLNQYGPEEEARRLALFCKHVANYKSDHRKDTELVIALNGDLGQGIIHSPEHTPAMTTQFAAMVHLISQAISYLANEYKSVRVICTTGNHLRFMHKSNKGRQTDKKFDGFHTMTHVALRYALQQHKNVNFEIPVTPYALVDIMGHKFLILHGDTVLSTGNVGKNISTESIKNKVNDLISGLGRIDVVVMGHLHVPTYTILNNGAELIVNGSMSGIDEYCQSLGIMKNIPSQQMFEVTENYAVGDMRFVRLLEADKQEDLEKIVEPFKALF